MAYGEKRTAEAGKFKGHVDQLAASVQELARMEKQSQGFFLKMATDTKWFL